MTKQFRQLMVTDLESLTWDIHKFIDLEFKLRANEYGVEIPVRGKIILNFDDETREFVFESDE